jgi:uncharacterized protein with HEPN domain
MKVATWVNILVHYYLGVNLTRVWEIVERDVPELKGNIDAMLAALGEKP